jgi:UrcA family protein
MKSPLILALGLASSVAALSPVHAQETATSIVRTADLDLASHSGRAALEERIVRAARDVCGTASDIDLEGKNAVRHCRAQVIAEASARRDQILAARSGGKIVVAAR